jgi:two-component system response regulator YesN
LQGGIPKLMQDLNYNQIYINRIFKKATGMSIGTYLNETRLQFALTYLKTSNFSVNDISDILGFSSPSFFYKKFREKYGITPNDYRTNIYKHKHIIL